MSTRRRLEWLGVLTAGLLASAVVCPAEAVSPRVTRAIQASERAVRLRTQLESRPEGGRSVAEYRKVIEAFGTVYRIDPDYRQTPSALAAVGELYEEMGRAFLDDTYYLSSIKAYEFLIANYPYSTLSRDALFTVGEVYRSDLNRPEDARKVFEEYIQKYPHTGKAAQAAERLKQIGLLARHELEEMSQMELVAGSEAPAPHEHHGGFPQVTSVHCWVGPGFTRVVIGVESEVKIEASRVHNPDRLVFDLLDSQLSRALAGKTFPVGRGFLRQVRIAQFKPSVTRTVLDVAKLEQYSVFSLPNPYRVVIDIRGPAPAAPSNTELAGLAETKPPRTVSDSSKVRRTGPDRETLARTPVEKQQAKSAGPGAEARRAPAAASTRATTDAAREDSETSRSSPPAGEPTQARSQAAERKVHDSPRQLPTPARSEAPDVARLDRPSPPDHSKGEGEQPKAKVERPVSPPENPPATPAREATTAAVQPLPSAPPGPRTLTRVLGLKIGRIVIDPGHGGRDTGTRGPHGLLEKDLVLDVGLRLSKLLEEEAGADVIMTRRNDTFIPLEERTAIANQKAADLFISIHANASRDPSARGVETYYLNFTSDPHALEVAARENSSSQESVHELQSLVKKIVLTEKIKESEQFADDVQQALYRRLDRAALTHPNQRNRGVKKAPFVVLIGTSMPSILAEVSFLTNPNDEKQLKKPEYRQRIAEALYQGVIRYVNTLGGVRVAERTDSDGGMTAQTTTARRTAQAGSPVF